VKRLTILVLDGLFWGVGLDGRQPSSAVSSSIHRLSPKRIWAAVLGEIVRAFAIWGLGQKGSCHEDSTVIQPPVLRGPRIACPCVGGGRRKDRQCVVGLGRVLAKRAGGIKMEDPLPCSSGSCSSR
jgi:hypothetical protein